MTEIRPFTGPHVWTGAEIGATKRWIRDLTPAHLADLDRAIAKTRGMPWEKVTKADFPLPSFAPLVDEIREELENGTGIFRLQGMPVGTYEMEDIRRMYYAVGGHIGTLITQNRFGEMMRTICDEGTDVGERYGQMEDKNGAFLSSYARTKSAGGLRFHTDRTDVVTLLCVGQAKKGGHSKIASTCAIHNVMLARRPDLVELLYNDVWRSRLGEEEGGDKLVYNLPVFAVRDGKFTSHYSRTYVEAAQKLPNVPKLSAKQDEALDLLAEVAHELCYEMTLKPGDFQLLNNHVIYHARDPFEDDKAAGQVRLLLRLWLSMPNSRPLPENHRILWRNVEAGAVRGGIQPRDGRPVAAQ
jgi:hypothetical protein